MSLRASEVRRCEGAEERRFISQRPVLRESSHASSPATVRGYAALFESVTDLGDFDEVIAPGAFDRALNDDVRALFNHDANLILARTKSRTLSIGVDRSGLWYQFQMPDTNAGRDLTVSLQRGDVDQSSFAFVVEKAKWSQVNGRPRRRIEVVSRLYDVSPVTFPAYPSTTVGLVTFTGGRAATPISILRKRLELAEVEGPSAKPPALSILRARLELGAIE